MYPHPKPAHKLLHTTANFPQMHPTRYINPPPTPRTFVPSDSHRIKRIISTLPVLLLQISPARYFQRDRLNPCVDISHLCPVLWGCTYETHTTPLFLYISPWLVKISALSRILHPAIFPHPTQPPSAKISPTFPTFLTCIQFA